MLNFRRAARLLWPFPDPGPADLAAGVRLPIAMPVLPMPAPRPAVADPAPAPIAKPPRRAVKAHEAVMGFTVWMREWGWVGWFPSGEVLEFYRWYSAEENLEEINAELLLERLASAPGVSRDRLRLRGTKVKRLVEIRKQLGGVDRATLYRIATAEEMAERTRRAGAKGRRTPEPLPLLLRAA